MRSEGATGAVAEATRAVAGATGAPVGATDAVAGAPFWAGEAPGREGAFALPVVVPVPGTAPPLLVPPANQQSGAAPDAVLPGAWSPEQRRAVFAAARAAAEEALGLSRVASPLRREAIASAVRDALAVLARSWDEDEPLRFHLGEQLFGRGAPPPWGALALDPGDDEPDAPVVFVDGQIDRIDLSADGVRVRVIDYKTGRPPEGDAKRVALQLPLYAAVAARALGASKVEAMYLRVNARGMIEESPKRPPDRVVKPEDLLERSREARRAVQALWEGRVAPRPAFLALCARCDARDVCRRPAVMPIEDMEDRS